MPQTYVVKVGHHKLPECTVHRVPKPERGVVRNGETAPILAHPERGHDVIVVVRAGPQVHHVPEGQCKRERGSARACTVIDESWAGETQCGKKSSELSNFYGIL